VLALACPEAWLPALAAPCTPPALASVALAVPEAPAVVPASLPVPALAHVPEALVAVPVVPAVFCRRPRPLQPLVVQRVPVPVVAVAAVRATKRTRK
jgi:hypothetical protein